MDFNIMTSANKQGINTMSSVCFLNNFRIKTRKTSPFRLLAPLLLLLILPVQLMALASDRDQPIELEADTADIDDLKGISIYTGNVVLTQGTMVIKAWKLTLYNDKNKKLEKAVAIGQNGKLATFKQRPEGKDQDLRARARTMIYYLKKDKIHLLKQAHVWQGGDTFEGDKIIYDTKRETVMASSNKSEDGKPVKNGSRVKVTIQPQSSNNQ
jgi:lipopolysaccharide export system protein LptA